MTCATTSVSLPYANAKSCLAAVRKNACGRDTEYVCTHVITPPCFVSTGLAQSLSGTVGVFLVAQAFLSHTAKEMSQATLSNAIIGMVGDLDRPQQPDQKGFASMERYLTGYTDEMRQERREQVLGTTAKDFKEFGERLGAVSKTGTVAVVGSSAALESAEVAGLGLDVTKLL